MTMTKVKGKRMSTNGKTDTQYFYFQEPFKSKIAHTESLTENIKVDLDKDGKLIGVEIIK